jgi:hypothetical protein
MGTAPQPNPEPAPAAAPATVKCPSCGSEYRPATRELVADTNLAGRIRELEADVERWRTECRSVAEERDRLKLERPAPAPAPDPEPPKRKKKSFDEFVNEL